MDAALLIVGENPLLKVSLKYQLKGYSLIEKSNNYEALNLLRQPEHRVALVVLEAQSKPLEAEEFCQAVRHTPALAHLGLIVVDFNKLTDDDLAEKLLATQANYYLLFPLKIPLLIAYIKNFLTWQQNFVPAVMAPPPTEQKFTENEIWQRELLESMPLPIMLIDLQGNITLANTLLYRLFQFKPTKPNVFEELARMEEDGLSHQLRNVLEGRSALEQVHNYHYQDAALSRPIIFDVLTTPLQRQDRQEGAIVILEEVTQRFQAINKLKDAYQETKELMAISNMLVDVRDFNQVVDRIFAELKRLFPFEGLNVLLEDEELEQLTSFRLLLPETLQLKAEEREELVSLTYSAKILELFRSRHLSYLYTPQVEPKRYTDWRFKRAYDLAPIKSTLLCPLGNEQECFGLLSCTTYDKVLTLSEDDIQLVQRYVSQLSIALKNARLYNELNREKDLVSRTLKDLSEAKKFTDSILHYAPVAIFTLNRKGILTSLNPASREIFGCTSNEMMIGQNWREVITQSQAELQLYEKAFSGMPSRLTHVPYRFPLTEKEVVLEMTITPLYSEEMISGTLHVYQDVTLKAKAEAELVKVHQRLQKEIEDTAFVQRLLLPSIQPNHPRFDIYGDVIPAAQCSGDWWSYIDYHEDGILVAVGDVTGHGVPSAMVTAVTDGGFTFYDLQRQQVTPDQLLRHLNEVIVGCVRGGYNMTMWLGWFQPAQQRVLCANAGHNFPYHLTCEGKIKEVPTAGSVLGRTAGTHLHWELREISYAPGDRFVIYTDGIIENESSANEAYGKRRLRKILQECPLAESSHQMWQRIVNDVRGFLGPQSHESDDMSLVVIKAL